MPVRVRHHLAHRRAAGKKLLEISGDKAFESKLIAADGNIAYKIVEPVLQSLVGASASKPPVRRTVLNMAASIIGTASRRA